MTAQKLPGSDAARHGTGNADLTIMIAAHEALRRDLESLVRAAGSADLADPARRRSVSNGWEIFKRQLHIHHTAEDEQVWPALRERLARSENALSVLDAMEEEHHKVDPLLAAVDRAFASAVGDPGTDPADGGGRLTEAIEPLVSSLTGHLAHEERDALPLIGMALTEAEWRGVGRRIAMKNLSNGPELFAWLLHGAPPEQVATAIGTLPPPARLLYRRIWKPRYEKASRW
jgi:iron-sulfur cluster repair protein YtfE (RIC family)